MIGSLLTRISIGLVSAISVVGLVYVYAFPPPSLRMTCENVSHFAPPVKHPETGEPMSLNNMTRHYRLGTGG